MSQDLSGLTVVVAGPTSAAGVAVVRTLSQAGARVAAVDILEDRVQELAAAYDNVTAMPATSRTCKPLRTGRRLSGPTWVQWTALSIL